MKNASPTGSLSLNGKARLKHGKDEAKRVGHKHFGEFVPSKKRADPIATLRAGEASRVATLLPVKYGRMLPNAFAFFRGSVGIMAKDLAASPQTNLLVQLCGDAHLQNLGCFASPDGRIVFDITDFDETAKGAWEWDVKRMATSIVLAGSQCGHDDESCAASVADFAGSYCKTMIELAKQPVLLSARHLIHRPAAASSAISKAFQQAERTKPSDLLVKYATKIKGRYRFKKVAGEWPVTQTESVAVLRSLNTYRKTLPPDRCHFFHFYKAVDVAFKIVGTGSVGLRDYVVLMEGRDSDDALFLQVKQEVLSTYAPYVKMPKFENEGQRVVIGQHCVQPVSDLLLGWTKIGKYDYLVRQLNDHKGSLNIENMKGKGLSSLAEVAGELLARGHARSGDALAIAGYLGDNDKISIGIVNFAKAYAKQVEKDFAAFKQAVSSKRLPVANS